MSGLRAFRECFFVGSVLLAFAFSPAPRHKRLYKLVSVISILVFLVLDSLLFINQGGIEMLILGISRWIFLVVSVRLWNSFLNRYKKVYGFLAIIFVLGFLLLDGLSFKNLGGTADYLAVYLFGDILLLTTYFYGLISYSRRDKWLITNGDQYLNFLLVVIFGLSAVTAANMSLYLFDNENTFSPSIWQFKYGGLPIYLEPSTESQVVGFTERFEPVHYGIKKDGWTKIQREDGTVGWVRIPPVKPLSVLKLLFFTLRLYFRYLLDINLLFEVVIAVITAKVLKWVWSKDNAESIEGWLDRLTLASSMWLAGMYFLAKESTFWFVPHGLGGAAAMNVVPLGASAMIVTAVSSFLSGEIKKVERRKITIAVFSFSLLFFLGWLVYGDKAGVWDIRTGEINISLLNMNDNVFNRAMSFDQLVAFYFSGRNLAMLVLQALIGAIAVHFRQRGNNRITKLLFGMFFLVFVGQVGYLLYNAFSFPARPDEHLSMLLAYVVISFFLIYVLTEGIRKIYKSPSPNRIFSAQLKLPDFSPSWRDEQVSFLRKKYNVKPRTVYWYIAIAIEWGSLTVIAGNLVGGLSLWILGLSPESLAFPILLSVLFVILLILWVLGFGKALPSVHMYALLIIVVIYSWLVLANIAALNPSGNIDNLASVQNILLTGYMLCGNPVLIFALFWYFARKMMFGIHTMAVQTKGKLILAAVMVYALVGLPLFILREIPSGISMTVFVQIFPVLIGSSLGGVVGVRKANTIVSKYRVGLCCPNCHVKMVPSLYFGILVEKCPSCEGVWFDRDELDALEDKKFALDNWKGSLIHREKDTERECPICEEPMHTFKYRLYNLEIDYCIEGHGFWLDKGEGRRVLDIMTQRKKDIKRKFQAEKEWRELLRKLQH
ncbi:MAG: hypothetical protein D6732_23230 [Methanobacteriota archaeon]|nr:MAG: hypothetical protein D6732_23230 [Euryarchaeota archaeon]